MTKKRSKTHKSDSCQFPFADGRQCRMLRRHDHHTLCVYHAREENQLLESQQLGAELAATLTGNFLTATDVNHVLGKLFTALAQNRIPPRNAATLAYIGQLMLRSLPKVKDEYDFEYDYESWSRMLARATPLSNSAPRSQPSAAASAPPAPANVSQVATEDDSAADYSDVDNDHAPGAEYDSDNNSNSDEAPDDNYDTANQTSHPANNHSAPN